jgi:hypothetical protein
LGALVHDVVVVNVDAHGISRHLMHAPRSR